MPRLKGSAMPSAVAFSVLMLIVGMIMIMTLEISSMHITHLEEKEHVSAALHALGLEIMRDTLVIVDEEFKEYKPFKNSDKRIEARTFMHGLYGIVEMRCNSAGITKLTRKMIFGSAELPLKYGLLVPSEGNYMSIGRSCRFKSPLSLPNGVYREINDMEKARCLEDMQISYSPENLPELNVNALKSVKGIYIQCKTDVITLDSKDSIPDTIVSAKIIKVDSSFNNSIQLFATDSILVSSGAVLKYPSGIFVNSSSGHIMIDSCAVVEGYVIVCDLDNENLNVSRKHLSFHQKYLSCLRGLLYIKGSAQLNGHITGSAYVECPVEQTDKGLSRMTICKCTQTENTGYAYPLIFENKQRTVIIKEYETPL